MSGKRLQTIVILALLIVSSYAKAIPRPPEYVKVAITRNEAIDGMKGVQIYFKWIGKKPVFELWQAVEFEFIFLTNKPNCFGQPDGGKDNRTLYATTNLPDSYTDVWNLYRPTGEEVLSTLEQKCNGVDEVCKFALEHFDFDFSDASASLAVGVKKANLIEANVLYIIKYPLVIPDDPDCHAYENGLAWSQINMTVIPNTCEVCGSIQTCPYLIGFEGCSEMRFLNAIQNEEDRCRSWIKRLCSPTAFFEFSPQELGYSNVECGNGEAAGGICVDKDEDGYFALQNNKRMFGSYVGDCNDIKDDPESSSIHNERYNDELGVCNPAEELDCQNDIDDDYDGLFDCYDPDCVLDPHCLITCTPICNPGQTRCNGNNVEVCSADQCSYEFSYSCGSNQTCTSGSCVTTTVPKPEINSVSCTSYFRGDTNVTCTVYGSNFDCGFGANAFIANFYNGPAQSCSSTQFTVSGNWVCNQELGFKQVSYRNPDNQRDDRTDLLELQMGELTISDAWQQTVHEGATNVPMGANGCNFGPDVVLFVEGIAITNTHLQAEDQVLGNGEVTWPAGSPPSMLCVAKYSGASIGFDKKCLYGYVTIVP